jgi:hypothetical protein
MRVSWSRNPEPDISGYVVERTTGPAFSRRFLLNDKPVADTLFVDSIPKNSELTYGYLVHAVDRSANRSVASGMVRARARDIVPPGRPVITSLKLNGDTVLLGWTGNSAPDFAHFNIYRSVGSAVGYRNAASSPIPEFSEKLDSFGLRYYAVSAVDSSGNESERSRPMPLLYEDRQAPPAPDSGNIENSARYITVRWWPRHSPKTAGYVLTRTRLRDSATVTLAELGPEKHEFRDLHAELAESYAYAVRARDKSWRLSAPLLIVRRP